MKLRLKDKIREKSDAEHGFLVFDHVLDYNQRTIDALFTRVRQKRVRRLLFIPFLFMITKTYYEEQQEQKKL